MVAGLGQFFFFFRLDLGGVVCSDGFGGGFRS